MAAVNVPCVQPFDVEAGDSQAALGPKWDKWLLSFENYMTFIAIQEDGQNKNATSACSRGKYFRHFHESGRPWTDI